MKKFIYLILSMAVATSAFAGVKANHVQMLPLQQTSKAAEFPMTAVTSNHLNPPTTEINAPRIMPKQREVIPCEGLRVLERSTSLRAVVDYQPEGTVTGFMREGKALTLSNDSYTNADQTGYVTAVVNGNKIWFKNLFYDSDGNFDDYWIEGTKTGSNIIIDLGQDIMYSSYLDAYIRIGWGQTRVLNGNLKFYHNTIKTEATFTIIGNVLTLNDAKFTSDYTGMGLVAYWSDDDSFAGEALFTTTLTEVGDIPEPPVMYTDDDIDTMSGEFVQYYRTGYAIYRVDDYIELGEQKGMSYLFFDEDGVTVYMRNPVYGWGYNTWIKGTKEGNTLTFPLGQYVYWDDETFYGLRTTWGAFVQNDDYYNDDLVTEVTFTIDGDHIIMNNCGMPDENSYTGLALMIDSAYIDLGWYGDLDFYTIYYNIPNTPTDVTVEPGSSTANVDWSDEVNNMWNVRYREYLDPSTVDFYFNDFEAYADLDNLTGWDMDGDGNWWSTRMLDDGTICLTSASYDNNTGPLCPDNWLLFPEVRLDGVVKLTAWGQDPNYAAEVFKVYIFNGDVTSIDDPESYFIGISDDIVTTGDKTEYTFVIPDEYQGQMGYVAIRHYNVCDEFMLNIDDVFVGDPDSGSPWISIYGVEQPNVILDGLTPETTYEVQVQGVNDGGVGMWTNSVCFTTLADQPQPTIIRGDVNDDGVVDLHDAVMLSDYLLDPDTYLPIINYDNAAICDALTGDDSEIVDAKDLTALFRYVLSEIWPDR